MFTDIRSQYARYNCEDSRINDRILPGHCYLKIHTVKSQTDFATLHCPDKLHRELRECLWPDPLITVIPYMRSIHAIPTSHVPCTYRKCRLSHAIWQYSAKRRRLNCINNCNSLVLTTTDKCPEIRMTKKKLNSIERLLSFTSASDTNAYFFSKKF